MSHTEGVAGPSDEVVTEFKAHDIVDFLGVPGVIVKIQAEFFMHDYPVHVRLNCGREMYFTEDGCYIKGQTPSLKVTNRPSVINKPMWRWVYKDSEGEWNLTKSLIGTDLRDAEGNLHVFPYGASRVESSRKMIEVSL